MSEMNLKTYHCKNCGAPLQVGAHQASNFVVCQACHTQNMIENIVKNAEIAAKQNINSGIPLTVEPDQLHDILVKALASSPNLPLDVFSEVEVISETHVCVPAYCFEVTGNMSYTVEVGQEREREQTRASGDSVTVRTIEYSTISGTSNASATMFVAGSREMADVVTALYRDYDTGALVDIEDLAYPEDVYTCNPDMPQTTAFNQFVRPAMERILLEKAEMSLSNSIYRNLTTGGTGVARDETLRVFVGIYQITYRYKGQEYYLYVTGDGRGYYCDSLPNDESRVAKAQALQNELRAVKDKSWIAPVAGIALGVLLIALKASFIAAAIVCAVVWIVLKIILGRQPKAERAAIQAKIDAFNREPEEAMQRFISSGRRLNGIYSNI